MSKVLKPEVLFVYLRGQEWMAYINDPNIKEEDPGRYTYEPLYTDRQRRGLLRKIKRFFNVRKSNKKEISRLFDLFEDDWLFFSGNGLKEFYSITMEIAKESSNAL